MSTLDEARKYIANGWSVFPIPYGKKKPIIAWGEFRERYATDEELVGWFGSSTPSNIGIVCGKLSNLSVLDADGVLGIKLLGSMGLTSSGTVITGSGGKQLYYTWDGERNKWESGKDHQGLDLRGEGGYVVAPPSLHPNGRTYRWVNGMARSSALLPFPSEVFVSKASTNNGDSTVKPEPWLMEAMSGVRMGLPRHGILVKLASYYVPRHPYEMCKHLLLEWNKKNDEPYPEVEVLKQLSDINKRFAKGEYKSTFKMKKETVHEYGTATPNSSKETLEISTPKSDAQAYLASVSVTPSPPELPTGFATIDEATWGVHRGDVFCIGARPGTGKTSFAVNVTTNLCKAGKRVLYFSTEMSKEELYNAISACEGDINAGRLYNKQLNDDDKLRLINFMPKLEAYDVHHVKFFTPDQKAVGEAVDQIKPDLLVIDHLQHIAGGDNKYEQIDKFMKFLKKLAMEKNIAVLVSSQLKRKDDGTLPTMNDLKECGTIEEESAIVILMHKAKKDITTPVLFIVDKNRHGRCGNTTLLFEGEFTRFKDMAVKVQ